MQKLIQIIKSIKLTQVLGVFLASSLLVVSTACSQGNIAQGDSKPSLDTETTTSSNMNGYSDNLRSNRETEAKAKALIDAAKSRQKDNLGDYTDSLTERAQDKIEQVQEDLPDYVESQKDKAVADIQKRTETLKENVSNASDEAKKVFEGTVDTAKSAVEDATEASKNTAKELKGNIQDLT